MCFWRSRTRDIPLIGVGVCALKGLNCDMETTHRLGKVGGSSWNVRMLHTETNDIASSEACSCYCTELHDFTGITLSLLKWQRQRTDKHTFCSHPQQKLIMNVHTCLLMKHWGQCRCRRRPQLTVYPWSPRRTWWGFVSCSRRFYPQPLE